jgi:hypothetical protein
MLNLNLLSADQYAEIGAWVERGKTSEGGMPMPPHLSRT